MKLWLRFAVKPIFFILSVLLLLMPTGCHWFTCCLSVNYGKKKSYHRVFKVTSVSLSNVRHTENQVIVESRQTIWWANLGKDEQREIPMEKIQHLTTQTTEEELIWKMRQCQLTIIIIRRDALICLTDTRKKCPHFSHASLWLKQKGWSVSIFANFILSFFLR